MERLALEALETGQARVGGRRETAHCRDDHAGPHRPKMGQFGVAGGHGVPRLEAPQGHEPLDVLPPRQAHLPEMGAVPQPASDVPTLWTFAHCKSHEREAYARLRAM